jgi:hypothetical protein
LSIGNIKPRGNPEAKNSALQQNSKLEKQKSKLDDGPSSPLNTSGSSLTEEIFNTALSNLEFLSDDDCDD